MTDSQEGEGRTRIQSGASAAMQRFNSSKVQKFKVLLDRFEPDINNTHALREQSEAYSRNFGGESEALRFENARFWNQNPDATAT